ncbi:MAG TPA: ribbon-helix-helix protein, CopG family [Sphaerochaeta sp.]|nr:ribbon-helix-helix protein, CopG family [Sphaerochaeta sp.]
MGETVRFGVSMDSSLVVLLDQITEREQHDSRSETIRELVRKEVISFGKDDDSQAVIATLTALFHQGTRLPRVPVDEYPSLHIIANLQFHVEEEICQKVIIVSGIGSEVKTWAQQVLRSPKVISTLTYTATDELFSELRATEHS